MWKDIIGHGSEIEELRSYIRSGRLPQAFLFAGPPGIGKTKVAREFFKAVNCIKSPGNGCDACRSCLKVTAGSHPDLIAVNPSPEWILIEDIRKVITEAGLKPYEARSRIVIIEPAERMNKASSNAMLKTLEEPPEGTQIILISHKPSLLLPTIVSRCRVIRFTPVDASALSNRAVHPSLLRLTSGAIGGLTSTEKEYISKMRPGILQVMEGGDPVRLVNQYLSEQEQGSGALSALLVLVESILRDLLILAHGGKDIINEELRDMELHGISASDAEALAECLHGIRLGANENINQRAAANELLMRLKEML